MRNYDTDVIYLTPKLDLFETKKNFPQKFNLLWKECIELIFELIEAAS